MRNTFALLVCAATLGFVLATPAEAGRRKIYKPKPVAKALYVPLFLGVGY